MRVIECKQRSSAWLEARCGKVTASNVHAVIAVLKRKEGEAQVRKDYKARLVCETLTGRYMENYVSDAMQWGILNEGLARSLYEIQCDVETQEVGFVLHPVIDRAGCSPDGLLLPNGGLEIKCPNTTTHLDYILSDAVPQEYQPQLLWNMACCEAEWWDFASYDPRMPEHLQLFVKRFERDEKRIGEMEQAVERFLAEVDDMIAKLPKATDVPAKVSMNDALAGLTAYEVP